MNTRRREATHKRLRLRADELEVDTFASPNEAPDARLAALASAQVVRELLDALPIEQAEVLALYCVLGYTVPEIAGAVRVPAETVRSRLRLAKQALREHVRRDARLTQIVEESS